MSRPKNVEGAWVYPMNGEACKKSDRPQRGKRVGPFTSMKAIKNWIKNHRLMAKVFEVHHADGSKQTITV